jgi:hypothetical protein
LVFPRPGADYVAPGNKKIYKITFFRRTCTPMSTSSGGTPMVWGSTVLLLPCTSAVPCLASTLAAARGAGEAEDKKAFQDLSLSRVVLCLHFWEPRRGHNFETLSNHLSRSYNSETLSSHLSRSYNSETLSNHLRNENMSIRAFFILHLIFFDKALFICITFLHHGSLLNQNSYMVQIKMLRLVMSVFVLRT